MRLLGIVSVSVCALASATLSVAAFEPPEDVLALEHTVQTVGECCGSEDEEVGQLSEFPGEPPLSFWTDGAVFYITCLNDACLDEEAARVAREAVLSEELIRYIADRQTRMALAR